MPDDSILNALKTRQKCTDRLIILIDALDKIDPILQMSEIQRIVENIGKLIQKYKESTQILSNVASVSEKELTTVRDQEKHWQEFLIKMKNFNLKFHNKYIECQKLNDKFQKQDMIKKSYKN